MDSTDGTPAKITKPCCLDAATQSLIKLIFDQDMFKEAMSQMNIGKYMGVFNRVVKISQRFLCQIYNNMASTKLFFFKFF